MNADRSRDFLAASRVALVVRSVVARHAGYRGCCYNGRSPSKEDIATSPVANLETPATTIAPTVPSQRLWRHAFFETKNQNRKFSPGGYLSLAAAAERARAATGARANADTIGRDAAARTAALVAREHADEVSELRAALAAAGAPVCFQIVTSTAG